MLKSVNQPIRKKDAMALVTGKPVYMDDLGIFDHALIVKALRSPHAHAMIESIDTKVASRIPGIEAIFTYEDVPNERFTLAGQTYPELSPYDRLIMDRHIRCVGDPVALVAGTDEKAIDRALKAIKVKYEILPALLDFHDAIGSDILIHPEDNWKALDFIGADNKTNRCASETTSDGDVEAVLADCDIVIDHVYHTKANQQTMMETFRTGCYMDTYGRLNIVSSTQIVYHVRRIISHALGIPKSRIRVQKPRIGGGFGAKQSAVCEVYPAFVTYKTGKPCKMIYSRVESQMHLFAPPRDGGACPPRRDEERTHPRDGYLHPLEHRRLRRARPDNGWPVRPQVHPAVHDEPRSLALCLRCCLYERDVRRRLPRIRSHTGYLRCRIRCE